VSREPSAQPTYVCHLSDNQQRIRAAIGERCRRSREPKPRSRDQAGGADKTLGFRKDQRDVIAAAEAAKRTVRRIPYRMQSVGVSSAPGMYAIVIVLLSQLT
jgi:hypothetical protein